MMFHKLNTHIWLNACLSFFFALGITVSTFDCVFFMQSQQESKTVALMNADSYSSSKSTSQTVQFQHSCTYCQISNHFALFSPSLETTQLSFNPYFIPEQHPSPQQQALPPLHSGRAPPLV